MMRVRHPGAFGGVMNQATGLPPRPIRIEVPASVLSALAERLAPVLHAFVDEQRVDERQAACALQAYAGAITATAGMRIDAEAAVNNQVPSFMVGWHWGADLVERASTTPANDGSAS